MTNNDYFETSELSLASALLCSGYKLVIVERRNPKSIFLFERSEFLDQAIQGFWAGEMRLEPKQYFNSIKEVKSRLYQN
jgi:hypothetical protein